MCVRGGHGGCSSGGGRRRCRVRIEVRARAVLGRGGGARGLHEARRHGRQEAGGGGVIVMMVVIVMVAVRSISGGQLRLQRQKQPVLLLALSFSLLGRLTSINGLENVCALV